MGRRSGRKKIAVSIGIPIPMNEQLEYLIDEDPNCRFQNKSELISVAIEQFLERETESFTTEVDGVEKELRQFPSKEARAQQEKKQPKSSYLSYYDDDDFGSPYH